MVDNNKSLFYNNKTLLCEFEPLFYNNKSLLYEFKPMLYEFKPMFHDLEPMFYEFKPMFYNNTLFLSSIFVEKVKNRYRIKWKIEVIGKVVLKYLF